MLLYGKKRVTLERKVLKLLFQQTEIVFREIVKLLFYETYLFTQLYMDNRNKL